VAAPRVPDDRRPTWQTYAVTVDDAVDRDALVMGLRAAGIGSNIGTYALNRQPVYAAPHDCPVSDDLFARHVALPMFHELTEWDQIRVVETLGELTSRCG
jgi:dTDP-4-amino-4,6-dideoxygalactose transaminase